MADFLKSDSPEKRLEEAKTTPKVRACMVMTRCAGVALTVLVVSPASLTPEHPRTGAASSCEGPVASAPVACVYVSVMVKPPQSPEPHVNESVTVKPSPV